MRRVFVFLAGALSTLTFVSSVGAQTVGLDVQTITREEIAVHGVTRLSEIFWLADRVRTTSLDGFTVLPSIGALDVPQRPTWRIRVDGRRTDLGILDVQNINLLPVAVSAVDSVVIVSSPSIVGATIYDRGRIDIWTTARSTTEITSATASFSAINETGDPGPFRLTRPELANANVDKTGPDGYMDLQFSRDRSSTVAGGNVFQFIPSDTAVFVRNRAAFDVPTTPENIFIMPYGAYEYRAGATIIALRADGLVAEDMTFFREFGRELPTRLRRARIDASAAYRLGDQYTVKGGVTGQATTLANLDGATRRPMDWRDNRIRVDAALEQAGRRWTASLEVEHRRVKSANGISAGLAVTDISAGITGGWRVRRLRASGGVAGLVSNGAPGGSLTLGLAAPVTPVSSLTVGGSITRRPVGVENELLYFMHEGLRLGRSQVSLPLAEPATVVAADVGYRVALTQRTTVSGRSFLRSAWNESTASRAVVSDGIVFGVDRTDFALADGSVVGLAVDIRRVSGRSRHSASYSWQTVVGDDRSYEMAWSEVAQHRLSGRSNWRIAPTFAAFVAAWYFSSTNWFEYSTVDEQTAGRYASSIPSFVRADAGFAKGLFAGLVEVRVSLHNVFNEEIGFHPIGATFDRSIKVELILTTAK